MCEHTNGSDSATCTGSTVITNSGGTSATVDVLNASSSKEGSQYMDGTLSAPSFNWTSTTLAPGENTTLNVSVRLSDVSNDFDSDTAIESYNGVEASGENYYDGYVGVRVYFDLKATQVHN